MMKNKNKANGNNPRFNEIFDILKSYYSLKIKMVDLLDLDVLC